MEEQNKNLEQESQIQQEYNPVPHEKILGKRNNLVLIITIVILFLILVGGGIYWWIQTRESKLDNQINSAINNSIIKEVELKNDRNVIDKRTEQLTINNAGTEYIITAKDVNIIEDYNGAAWLEDSTKVYFMKYVEADLTRDMNDKLEEEYLIILEDRLKLEDSNSNNKESFYDLFSNLPEKYDIFSDLFSELQVFEYNIIEDKITFITSMDYNPGGYPVIFFVNSYIQDDQIIFGDSELIYKVNINNKKITSRPGPTPSSDNTVFMDEGTSRAMRYISPGSHSYFEIPRNSAFDYNSQTELRYFYDESIVLVAGDNILNEKYGRTFAGSIINNPENILDVTLLRSPEEIEFRKKLGLDKFDDK